MSHFNAAPLSRILFLSLLALAACSGAPKPKVAVDGHGRSVLAARDWSTESGAKVAILDYRGAPFVVTAVETSCVSRCPLTVEKLRSVDSQLRRQGIAAKFILVSLDPRTDTPATLARWKATRHLPQYWHLLSGSETDTRAFADYLEVDTQKEGDLDHEVRIAFFDADGRQTRSFHDVSFDASDVIGDTH